MRRHDDQTLQVLLVEDDPAWQHRISVGLGERGIRVHVHDRLTAAVAAFGAVQPDAVLVGDMLSDANGPTAIRRLQAIAGSRHIPVVLLTQREDDGTISAAFDAGASDVIVKSLRWTALSERLLHLALQARSGRDPGDAPAAPDHAARVRRLTEAAISRLAESRRRAHLDGLTGLLSRAGFVNQGDRVLTQRLRDGRVTAVMVVNIDGFRRINAALGRAGGDRVLAEIAERLRVAFRQVVLAKRQAESLPAVADVPVRRPRPAAAGSTDPAFIPLNDRIIDRALRRAAELALMDGASLFVARSQPFPELSLPPEMGGNPGALVQPGAAAVAVAAAAAPVVARVQSTDGESSPDDPFDDAAIDALLYGGDTSGAGAAPRHQQVQVDAADEAAVDVQHVERHEGTGRHGAMENGADEAGDGRDIGDGGPASVLIGRIRADEFMLLFADLPSAHAVESAAQIVFAHLRRPLAFNGMDLLLRASIGIALTPDDGRSVDVLLKRATSALYVARQQGGQVSVRYSEAFGPDVHTDDDQDMALLSATDRDELRLSYQPVIDVESGDPVAVEALMLWQRDGQMLPPAQFLTRADEMQLLFRMDEWAISHALQQLRRWQIAGTGIYSISVNVTIRHLLEASSFRAISSALTSTQLPASALTLDVSEPDVMQDPERSIRALQAVRRLGVRIALDNIGSSTTLLPLLARLPIHAMKIDRSLIRSMDNGRSSVALVAGLVAMGASLGLEVSASGVETAEQAALLRRMKCPRLQGYHFSRPLAANDLEAWWSTARSATRAEKPWPWTGQPAAAEPSTR